MQFIAIVIISLWLIYGVCLYQSDKDFGKFNAILTGAMFGLLYSIGTIAFVAITIFLIMSALGV